MNIILGLFIFFFKIKIIFSCNDINVHKEVMENILLHEGDKILKTNFEYSKYGIKNSIIKKYNKKYDVKYNIETLNKEEAIEIGIDLMNEYKINQIDSCNLKLVIYDLFYNAGPRVGALITQRTLNKYHQNFFLEIIEDGIMGTQTINNLNEVKNLKKFIIIFSKERLEYYSKFRDWSIYEKG